MTGALQLTDNLAQELRRGVLVLAILSQLRKEHYGYALRESLGRKGLEVAEGTLYPLLRRLESQGLLRSRWQLGEGRPRRYYQTSRAGIDALSKMNQEWAQQVQVLQEIIGHP